MGRPRRFSDEQRRMRLEIRAQNAYAEWHPWLESKKAFPCADCGGRFPSECMDFDHRDGEIKCFHVAGGIGRRRETVEAEIAKCDLICANCHRTRTRNVMRADRLSIARVQGGDISSGRNGDNADDSSP